LHAAALGCRPAEVGGPAAGRGDDRDYEVEHFAAAGGDPGSPAGCAWLGTQPAGRDEHADLVAEQRQRAYREGQGVRPFVDGRPELAERSGDARERCREFLDPRGPYDEERQ
jgi:hypothetical protein